MIIIRSNSNVIWVDGLNPENCKRYVQFPADMDINGPTVKDIFGAWNEKFHAEDDSNAEYLMVNFVSGSVTEMTHKDYGVIINEVGSDIAADICKMVEKAQEINWML